VNRYEEPPPLFSPVIDWYQGDVDPTPVIRHMSINAFFYYLDHTVSNTAGAKHARGYILDIPRNIGFFPHRMLMSLKRGIFQRGGEMEFRTGSHIIIFSVDSPPPDQVETLGFRVWKWNKDANDYDLTV